MKIVLLVEPVGAAEALAEDGQVLFGQETYRDDPGLVRHRNAKLSARRSNGGQP